MKGWSFLSTFSFHPTEYFNSGAAYRSVNVARSAISTTHSKLDGLPVDQNPLVIQLLKGMFSDCPLQPIYSQTWDVSCVTKYLLTLGNSRYLSLKQLLWKLAMSFALTFPERVSALTKLDLRYCPVLPEGVEFTFSLLVNVARLIRFPRHYSLDSLPTSNFGQLRHCDLT